jgi:FAD-dependent monooxygenase
MTQCEKDPRIDLRFGWKVEAAEEFGTGGRLIAVNVATNQRRAFVSRYIVGCDGASSRIRRDLKIPLDGGPV